MKAKDKDDILVTNKFQAHGVQLCHLPSTSTAALHWSHLNVVSNLNLKFIQLSQVEFCRLPSLISSNRKRKCRKIHPSEAENFRLRLFTHGKWSPNPKLCKLYIVHFVIFYTESALNHVWLWYMSGKGQNSMDDIADTNSALLPPT